MLIGGSLSPASVLVYLGAIYAGLVAVPVEERAVTASLGTLLEATGAKAVWTETCPRDPGVGASSVLRLHGDLAGDLSGMMPPVAVRDSDLAALMATSGSTGVPRFVMVSHGNLIANTEAIIRSQQLAGDDRAMLILPLNYCFGTSVLHTHLYAGGGVVLTAALCFPTKCSGQWPNMAAPPLPACQRFIMCFCGVPISGQSPCLPCGAFSKPGGAWPAGSQ